MGGADLDLKSPSVVNVGIMSAGVSTGCNSAGTTGTVSQQLIFCGGNNVTLSQSINGQSATITIVGGAGAAFSEGVSTGGNTAGTTGTVNNQVVWVGGNNITLSQSINGQSATITIIGATAGAASFSAGVSDLGNTLGTTGTISGQLVLVGGNNVTLSQSVNAGSATVTISVPSQSVQTQNLVDVTLSGNTSGTLALMSSGTVTLAGGNSITLSQVGNAITISGASTSQSVQTQNMIDLTLFESLQTTVPDVAV